MLPQNTGVHVHFGDSRDKRGYGWHCRVLVISSKSYLLPRLLTGDKMASSQPATAPLPAAFHFLPLRAPIPNCPDEIPRGSPRLSAWRILWLSENSPRRMRMGTILTPKQIWKGRCVSALSDERDVGLWITENSGKWDKGDLVSD